MDVLVVLDEIPLYSYSAEVDRTSELVSTLSLEYGVSVSRVFVSEKNWLESGNPFLRNVRPEAVPA